MLPKPIDLRAVQAARQRLDALAIAHPELTNKHGASVDAWVDVLNESEDSMGKTTAERQREYKARQAEQGNVQVALWLPADTVQAIDALRDKHGGTREGVVVAAVTKQAKVKRKGKDNAAN